MALIPNLAPDEIERLAILAEECGEVQQIIGKILRHGWFSTHPDGGPDNQALLQKELADVQALVRIMRCAGDISLYQIEFDVQAKLEKLERFTHHQTKDLFTAAKLNL